MKFLDYNLSGSHHRKYKDKIDGIIVSDGVDLTTWQVDAFNVAEEYLDHHPLFAKLKVRPGNYEKKLIRIFFTFIVSTPFTQICGIG